MSTKNSTPAIRSLTLWLLLALSLASSVFAAPQSTPAPTPSPTSPAAHRTPAKHTPASSHRRVTTSRRRRSTRTAAAPAAETSSVKVWVNIPSGVYHYPGTRWYGRTRDGKFMSEADARKEGDRPAMNNQ